MPGLLMSDTNLLLSEFLSNGRKLGLDENLLKKVFEYLDKHRFVPPGDREHIRAGLEHLLRKQLEGE